MSDIPDDVMRAALIATQDSPLRGYESIDGELTLIVARAILAERERLSHMESWPDLIGKGKTAIIRGGEPCVSVTYVDLDDDEWRALERAFSDLCRHAYANKNPAI